MVLNRWLRISWEQIIVIDQAEINTVELVTFMLCITNSDEYQNFWHIEYYLTKQKFWYRVPYAPSSPRCSHCSHIKSIWLNKVPCPWTTYNFSTLALTSFVLVGLAFGGFVITANMGVSVGHPKSLATFGTNGQILFSIGLHSCVLIDLLFCRYFCLAAFFLMDGS